MKLKEILLEKDESYITPIVDDVIKNKVNIMLGERNFDSNTNIITSNKDGIKNALISFYQIKLKLDLIELNRIYFLKKQFEDIYNILLEQKKENKNNTFL